MKNYSFSCELDNDEYYTSVESSEMLFFSPFATLNGIIESVDTDKEVSKHLSDMKLDIGDVVHINGLEKNQIVIGMTPATQKQTRLYNMRIAEANFQLFLKYML